MEEKLEVKPPTVDVVAEIKSGDTLISFTIKNMNANDFSRIVKTFLARLEAVMLSRELEKGKEEKGKQE
jgi:hypothetical protein